MAQLSEAGNQKKEDESDGSLRKVGDRDRPRCDPTPGQASWVAT